MHCTYGYLVLALAFSLSVIDTFTAATRLFSYVRSMEGGGKFSIRSFWNSVILGKEDYHVFGMSNAEYINLVADEPRDLDENFKSNVHHNHRTTTDSESIHEDETAQWVNDVRCHSEDSPETPVSDSTLVSRHFSRGCSQHSDDTVQEQVRFTDNTPPLRRLGKLVFMTVERVLVFAGFAQSMHGVVIYTGGCRENYINGCLAHMISKSCRISPIFFHRCLHSSRGRYLLVLWSFHLCPLSWIVLRVWLGVESRSHGSPYLSRVCRIICDILLRHNQHVDGAFWRTTWRVLYN